MQTQAQQNGGFQQKDIFRAETDRQIGKKMIKKDKKMAIKESVKEVKNTLQQNRVRHKLISYISELVTFHRKNWINTEFSAELRIQKSAKISQRNVPENAGKVRGLSISDWTLFSRTKKGLLE